VEVTTSQEVLRRMERLQDKEAVQHGGQKLQCTMAELLLITLVVLHLLMALGRLEEIGIQVRVIKHTVLCGIEAKSV